VKTLACSETALAETAAVLKKGGVAVIPTDTVYGLAAHPDFPEAVERLYTIKGREAKKPIALLAADVESVERFLGESAHSSCEVGASIGEAAHSSFEVGASIGEATPSSLQPGRRSLPKIASDLAARHWPGGLTLVLPKGDIYEGFRVPDHEWTRRLLAECGGVLRVTSANLSGRHAATDAPAALAEVGLSADIVVDGGISPGGVASTVVKIDPDGGLQVLRQGAVEI